ncbi:MAG: type III pantothenate kinase [Bacteroidales bacterium]|nr:type III pantothenate kinase [Bacteroidales bacterium]
MNLVLDIGNTRAKACVYDGDTLVFSSISDNGLEAVLDMAASISASYSIDRSIVASVASDAAEYCARLQESGINAMALTADTPVPIANNYATPRTLGLDRLAAAVGASVLYPDSNVMIIDAGSAVTYDVLMDGNTFCGGNIAPGMSMRFRALHEFTHSLPLLDGAGWECGCGDYGRTTADAIRIGVIDGLVHEMDGFIDDFVKKNVNTQIILTGGDSIFLSKKLKNTIFAEPNLVTIGLNRILNYNVYKKF